MGEEALRCAVRAERGAQRASGARSGACSGARSGAERCARLLLILRACAWHGIVQLFVAREGGGRRMRGAAGVQLYFPREDDDDMFICQTSRASIFLSIITWAHITMLRPRRFKHARVF